MPDKKKIKKEKFNPLIKEIKLNYEQAVLACSCYTDGCKAAGSFGHSWNAWVCTGPSGSKSVTWRNNWHAVSGTS